VAFVFNPSDIFSLQQNKAVFHFQVRDILRGTLAMECSIPNYLLQTKPPGPGGQILEMKETTSVAGEKKESSVAGEKKETT